MSLPTRFRLLGRGLHPVIESAEALRGVTELDDAYWVATAAPVNGLRGDPKFYVGLDTDSDGRIRSDELRDALSWTFDHLSSMTGLESGSTELPLPSIRVEGSDGDAILDAAQKVAGDAGSVELDRVREVLAEEVARGLSAAGRILPAAAVDDEALEGFLSHVMAVTGGTTHPSGDLAVDRESIDAFIEAGGAWLAWVDAGQVVESSDVMPLGEDTGAAHAAVLSIADKVDQYFLLCDAIALDADLAAKAKVDASGTDLLEPEQAKALLARAPLAVPRADGVLDGGGTLNPAWLAGVAALFTSAVEPLLGEGTRTLTRQSWNEVRGRVSAHGAWLDSKPADAAGDETLDLLRTRVSDATLVERSEALLAQSVAGAVAVEGLELLEKLILFQANLLRFTNNMVSMPELIDPDKTALCEQGRLVMDGREFDLSVRVSNAGRAEKFGGMSPIFTMFVMIGEKGGAWTDQIAVPVTAGQRGHLIEGQWGVFFPADGGEMHAQIRKISSSPISIWEAVIGPFRRISSAVQSAADKAATSSSNQMNTSVTSNATTATDRVSSSGQSALTAGESAELADPAVVTPPPAEAASSGGSSMTGQLPMLAAGAGIALAAVASAAAYVVDVIWSGAGALATGVLALPVVQALPEATQGILQVLSLPLALMLILLGILMVPFLLYAIPVAFATWLRLRKRDLASLLEGAGWAINTRLMLERPHAERLTRRPKVSARDLTR